MNGFNRIMITFDPLHRQQFKYHIFSRQFVAATTLRRISAKVFRSLYDIQTSLYQPPTLLTVLHSDITRPNKDKMSSNRFGPPPLSTHDLQDQIWTLQKELDRAFERISNLEAGRVGDREYVLELEGVLDGVFSAWVVNRGRNVTGNGMGNWRR